MKQQRKEQKRIPGEKVGGIFKREREISGNTFEVPA